jgi:hypothetical protein
MKRVHDMYTAYPASSTWRRVAQLCGFVVFAVVFLLANVSGWAHVPVTQHQADPHPFNAGLVFVETEVVGSSSETGSEYHGTLDQAIISIPVLTLHSGKSLFLQLQHANESREKISLFVLHHAWKNFLS